MSEVAAQFGVTRAAVRLWALTGQLEGEQTASGTWLFHESAVEEFRHNRNTQPSIRNGGTSIRPSVSNGQASTHQSRVPDVDPDKRYRIKSTGETVTGAELLRRRHQARVTGESAK